MRKDGKSSFQAKKEKLQTIRKLIYMYTKWQQCETKEEYEDLCERIWEIVKNE